jgi:hypothetical protein
MRLIPSVRKWPQWFETPDKYSRGSRGETLAREFDLSAAGIDEFRQYCTSADAALGYAIAVSVVNANVARLKVGVFHAQERVRMTMPYADALNHPVDDGAEPIRIRMPMEPDVGVKAPKPGLVFDNCEHSKLTLRHRGIIRNLTVRAGAP